MSQSGILNNAIFPPGSAIDTLTGNVGGAVGPDLANNVSIVGAGGITVTGNPGTNTLTITAPGAAAMTFTTNGGVATEAAGNINILGGSNIGTTGAGDTVTVNLDNNIVVASMTTSDAATAIVITDNIIGATGANANIDINITTKGTGKLVYDGIAAGYAGSQWRLGQAGVQTANAVATAIITVAVADSQMVTIKAYVNGFQNDFTDAIGGEVLFTVFRPAGGNVTVVGVPVINLNATDATVITANVDVGLQSAIIYVTGINAETWNWTASYNYMYTNTNA